MRRTVRDEFLAAVAAVPEVAAAGITPEHWNGDLDEYNPGGTTPAVSVAYGGLQRGELSKPGAFVKDRLLLFAVLVETHDKTAADGDGEGEAVDLLEAIEAHLDERKLPSGGLVEPVEDEEAVRAELGSHLYSQYYAVQVLVNRQAR